MDNVRDIEFLPGFHLEGFPNRDSTVYSEVYDIQSAETVLRGTLRYKVFLLCFFNTRVKKIYLFDIFSNYIYI